MRTIIAGSRTITRIEPVAQAVFTCGWKPSVVISGGARGVDLLGEEWATFFGIPVERYPADWNRHGRKAGLLRNTEMANIADALIAVWDGVSRGTSHMIDTATAKGLAVFVYKVTP